MPAYLWVPELDNTQPNQVLIGATADESYQNLVDAINARPDAVRGSPAAITPLAGLEFSLPTQENAAFNAANPSAGTFVITAKQPGTIGNTYGLTETTSNFSWSGSHATGGTDGTTTALSVGVLGSQAGTGLLYTRGSKVVTAAVAPSVATFLHVSYFRLGADHISLEDSTLVAARAAIEHGSGKYQMLLSDVAQTDPIAGTAEALQALTQFKVLPDQVHFQTYTRGLIAGQYLTINIASPLIAAALINGTWQIHQVSGQYMQGQNRFLYTVTVTSSTIASLIARWEQLTNSK